VTKTNKVCVRLSDTERDMMDNIKLALELDYSIDFTDSMVLRKAISSLYKELLEQGITFGK